MKLFDFKNRLMLMDSLSFHLPDGSTIPAHFHITEVGQIDKKYIDCGGTIRFETKINMQLWYSHDMDHRLDAKKLLKIIEIAQNQLNIADAEIEIEYQADTMGKYTLHYEQNKLVLKPTKTACLAQDQCGIPLAKPKKELATLTTTSTTCCGESGKCC